MSKPVLFYGKPSQLQDTVTHVRMQNLLSNTTSEKEKCARLASTFRGSALRWLTTEVNLQPSILHDYDQFVEKVSNAFALTEVAAKAKAARRYANLYQKTSAQLYGIEFKQLSTQLNIPDSTAVAQFVKGLKSHIREALIIQDETDDLDKAIEEAVRIDSQLYSSKRAFSGNNTRTSKGTKSYTQGKCHKCGQFGHKAKQCPIKSEPAPWN